jgi:hypothetical protein
MCPPTPKNTRKKLKNETRWLLDTYVFWGYLKVRPQIEVVNNTGAVIISIFWQPVNEAGQQAAGHQAGRPHPPSFA